MTTTKCERERERFFFHQRTAARRRPDQKSAHGAAVKTSFLASADGRTGGPAGGLVLSLSRRRRRRAVPFGGLRYDQNEKYDFWI